MTKIIAALSVLSLLSLTGCGPMRFRPDEGITKSDQDLYADTTNCESSNPYSGIIPARDYHERCMRGKGWVRTK